MNTFLPKSDANGVFDWAGNLAGAIVTADALKVANNLLAGNFNIHRAISVALFAADAGAFVSPKFKNANGVKQAQKCAVRTEIFAPGAFNKERATVQ